MAENEPARADGEPDTRPAIGGRVVEIVVAATILLFGAVVIFDSVRLGYGWDDSGPQPGYFPFYIGISIVLSSGGTLLQAVLRRGGGINEIFVERGQLDLVMAVLVPSIVYVGVMKWLGMYVASILFIAYFMRWLGKYDWTKTIVISVAVVVSFYFMFEIWFLVPLPKGPLEALLGIGQ